MTLRFRALHRGVPSKDSKPGTIGCCHCKVFSSGGSNVQVLVSYGGITPERKQRPSSVFQRLSGTAGHSTQPCKQHKVQNKV